MLSTSSASRSKASQISKERKGTRRTQYSFAGAVRQGASWGTAPGAAVGPSHFTPAANRLSPYNAGKAKGSKSMQSLWGQRVTVPNLLFTAQSTSCKSVSFCNFVIKLAQVND